ncbi:MAG: tetratricopeptide repeat protein [Patescibacteria group bacterium]|nr:tetratricopeptide repeat protein [Patescibacteria group bacterium]MDD5554416.1 tetratricopeptide repeat protein [Patescibacteria group bacterium]
MYNIIPLILILISLSIIVFIVVRKFSVLAGVDVDNIPAEREARVKERIISSRLKRNIFKWSSRITKVFTWLGGKLGIFSKWAYNKLHELKESYGTEIFLPTADKEKKIGELSVEAEEMIGEDNFKEAEKRLIEIIGLDSQNIEAFKNLGNLYFTNKNYEDARQTFEHTLRLLKDEGNNEEIAEVNFELALVNRDDGQLERAQEHIKEALKIVPNNPRYLDTILEISIMKKDKVLALDAYGKLAKANPDNQKLKDLKKQIDGL